MNCERIEVYFNCYGMGESVRTVESIDRGDGDEGMGGMEMEMGG